MNNRVVLITGAASGIGLEIAKTMVKGGYTVCLADVDRERVEEEATKLADRGFDCLGMRCDVTDEESLRSVIQTLVSNFGHLDILVNNAGMQYISPIEDFPADKFELLIKIMLTGSFLATKYVFPVMKAQGFGRIINMASINGLVGFAGKAAYNSAKHGVIGLTKVTALEGAPHGITANAVCPGYVDTPLVRNQLADLARERNVDLEHVLEKVIHPLVPQKRLLDTREIADNVLYLVSDSAKGITGQAIVIDGGYTAQ